MHHPLDLPYRDTRAEELRWSLAHDELPALVTSRPDGWPLRLRILGASHQVVVDEPGWPRLVETVAYVPGAGQPLPTSHVSTEVADATWVHELSTRVEEVSPDDLRARVDALLADLDGRPETLSAAFPGDGHAVTALLAERSPDGGVGWRTWHAYPQHGQLVHTRTHLRPVGRPDPVGRAVLPAPADPEESPCDVR